MDTKGMQRLETLYDIISVALKNIETKSETRAELLQIKKNFKRGMLNYRDVEKCVSDVVYSFLGDYVGITDEVVIGITSDILFNDGYLKE